MWVGDFGEAIDIEGNYERGAVNSAEASSHGWKGLGILGKGDLLALTKEVKKSKEGNYTVLEFSCLKS